MKINAKFFLKKEEFLDILEGNFKTTSNVILKSIIDILFFRGKDGINFDLVDLKSILGHGNNIFLGIVQNSYESEIKKLLDEVSTLKSLGVFFILNENFPILKVDKIMEEFISNQVDEDGEIIVGLDYDNSLRDEEFIIILIGVT